MKSRFTRLLSLSFVHLAVTAGAHAESAGSPTEKPNVILIMSDDQGWGDVGFNGNSAIKTPHLDRMAREGVRFERFYAASPL